MHMHSPVQHPGLVNGLHATSHINCQLQHTVHEHAARGEVVDDPHGDQLAQVRVAQLLAVAAAGAGSRPAGGPAAVAAAAAGARPGLLGRLGGDSFDHIPRLP